MSEDQEQLYNTAMRLLHSSRGEKDLALRQRSDASPVSQSIAQLKELYLKATNEAQQGSHAAAIETCETALPIISSTTTNLITSSELRKWTELLLTRFCVLSSHAIQNNNSAWFETDTLAAFRAWADFWQRQPGVTPNNAIGGRVQEGEVSRRMVWKEYYATISYILQNDLPYPTTIMANGSNEQALRLLQKAELTRVEHKYESLLLAEIQFPKAEQHSEEVEEWVEMVITNWKLLCGSSWDEQALGAGGRLVVSRNVLDILYRAATKTFHSTHILRELFTVHLALAEFDLAFKAFETYFEIAKKAKQRVEKTGIDEPGLDTDEELLRTISQCISALCRFGRLPAAEKARELARYLESWFETHDPSHPRITVNGNEGDPERRSTNGHFDGAHQISPRVIVQTWRSIGIAYAQWARLTYDAKSRSPYQLKAIQNLRTALSPEYGQEDDIDTLFALAIVLAERRQLGEAIRAVSAALQPSSNSTSASHADGYSGRFARERSLIPLWHLLALLLSAKEEFPEASRACEGAFKQFGDLDILFGDVDATYQSEHLQGLQEKTSLNAVIDDMDDFEKEAVLEVKITQLILAEAQDGPEEAINGTEELLSLYNRLFGDPSFELAQRPKTVDLGPPQTSTGTLKSVKGSLFRRKRNTVTGTSSSNDTSRPETAQVQQNAAPKIQVTGENGEGKHKHHGLHLHHHSKGDNLLRKKSQTSMKHRHRDGVHMSNHADETQGFNARGGSPSQHISDLEGDIIHLPPASVATPSVRFPVEQARRHKVGILVKVWLLIAGFYRRAEMLDDAKLAIDAAYELVESIEIDVLKDTTGMLHTDERGWGVGKCVEEMWGDVWAERGYLSLSRTTDRSSPFTALKQFEAALTHDPDHPSAIIGLSNILLDIYSETLLPPPSLPELVIPGTPTSANASTAKLDTSHLNLSESRGFTTEQAQHPLGLPSSASQALKLRDLSQQNSQKPAAALRQKTLTPLEPAHQAVTTLPDRLAARDRAHGLLDTLTKLGEGWDCAEAWWGLSRAYEAVGMGDKAKSALWWCVEVEEGSAVRGWGGVRGGAGRYVL